MHVTDISLEQVSHFIYRTNINRDDNTLNILYFLSTCNLILFAHHCGFTYLSP